MPSDGYDAFYLSYTGIGLPLNLVGPLTLADIDNRNTYFGANFDADGRIARIHKVVYGAVELAHSYRYHANGVLASADILDANDGDEELRTLRFDESGKPQN